MSAKAARASFAPALSGAFAAALIGVSSGAVLRPTPAESGLPKPPQLMQMTDVELAALEDTPSRVWPSVPVTAVRHS
ncbi:MAG TPA: hypothetical protein VIO94_03520 [Phenylobacterium sp.]